MSYSLAFVAFITVLLFIVMIGAVVNAGRRVGEMRRQRRAAQEQMKSYREKQRRQG